MLKMYLLLTMLLFTLASCSNDDDKNENLAQSDFCNQNRELLEQFENRSGKLIYLQEREKYAIRYYIPQTIDGVNSYILCENPVGIVVNDNVLFSGKSYLFNEDENFTTGIGGHEFYFFEETSINKID